MIVINLELFVRQIIVRPLSSVGNGGERKHKDY